VTGCYVSLEDYAASAAVFLRELAKDGYVFSRSSDDIRREDTQGHHLSIENAAHALLAGRYPHDKISA
jgi:hypothetical protein